MYSENSTLNKYCLGHSTIDTSYFGKGVCHPLSTQRTWVRGSLRAADYYSNDYCGKIGHKCCHLLAILHEKLWSPGFRKCTGSFLLMSLLRQHFWTMRPASNLHSILKGHNCTFDRVISPTVPPIFGKVQNEWIGKTSDRQLREAPKRLTVMSRWARETEKRKSDKTKNKCTIWSSFWEDKARMVQMVTPRKKRGAPKVH